MLNNLIANFFFITIVFIHSFEYKICKDIHELKIFD